MKVCCKLLIKERIAGQMLAENEGLEEPRHMREVPFGRARVFHRLDRHVLGGKRARRSRARVARGEQPVFEDALAVNGCALDRTLSRHRWPPGADPPAASDGERP